MTTLTIDQLLQENEDLRRRLEEAEEALRAMRAGEVDAVLVEGEREQVYTLESADKPYRLLVEQMPHAAATLTADGAIIYCNRRFADLLKRPLRPCSASRSATSSPPTAGRSSRPCCATAGPATYRGKSPCTSPTARRCRSTSASAPCRKAPSACVSRIPSSKERFRVIAVCQCMPSW